MEVLMNAFRYFLPILTLFLAVFSPQAQAMGFFPKAKQIVSMVMNPSVRSVLTQANRTVTNGMARNVARVMPEINQPVTQNLSRSFTTQAKITQTTQQVKPQFAVATGIGLAGIIGGAAYTQEESPQKEADQQTSLPKDFLITTDKETLLKMMKKNPDYARQFAQLVTVDNIVQIDVQILDEIVWEYPEAATMMKSAVAHHFATIGQSSYGDTIIRMILLKDPTAIALFTPQALKHFETLSNTYTGTCSLQYVISYEDNPKLIEQFAQRTAQHFKKFVTESYGHSFLRTLIQESSPESIEIVASSVIANMATLIESRSFGKNTGVALIESMIEKNEKVIELFTQSVIQNFATLLYSKGASEVIGLVMEKNPEAMETIAQLSAHNIVRYVFYVRDGSIERMMEKVPEARKMIIKAAAEHIVELVDFWEGYSFVENIMKEYPETVTQFTQAGVNQFEKFIKTKHGFWFVNKVIHEHPDQDAILAQAFCDNIVNVVTDVTVYRFLENWIEKPEVMQAAIQHFESLIKHDLGLKLIESLMPKYEKVLIQRGIQYLDTLIYNSRWRKRILTMMQSNNDAQLESLLREQLEVHIPKIAQTYVGRLILAHIALHDSQFKKIVEKFITKQRGSWVAEWRDWRDGLTPTELGFLSNYDKVIKQDPAVNRVIENVIALERKYEPTHYTFIHGRNREYDYISTVYGKLWKYAYNTEIPDDFIFTHTKDAHDPLTQQVLMHEERKLHEANIKERANIDGEIRNRRLFLNTQLFGNMNVDGSSSFSYFFYNSNVSHVKVTAENIFRQFGQQALYKKYKDEFESLKKEHAALTRRGELLVVAVPKERVNQDVTCMHVGGSAAPKYMINGKMTNNVQDILEARKKDPSIGDNALNFTLAMTDTAALDPKSGIKFHSVQAIDEQKYAAWQAKLDALMVKIESEFKASWQQSLKAKERGHGDLLDAVRASQKYIAAKEQK